MLGQPLPNLTIGDRGERVAALQDVLNRLGYNITVDGIFGAQTYAVVRDFQMKKGLVVDGIVGPGTLAALQSAIQKGEKIGSSVSVPGGIVPMVGRPIEKVEELSWFMQLGWLGLPNWSWLMIGVVVWTGLAIVTQPKR